MRIGILGGTFDPIHSGHLALAEAALTGLHLDEVLFVPAFKNPLKHGLQTASAKHRLTMVQLAIAREPRFAVSDIELSRKGNSFALETLQELHLLRPAEYWLLMGADTLERILEWKQPEKLVRLCRIGASIRPPMTIEHALLGLPDWIKEKVDIFPMEPFEASSTKIRLQLEHGFDPPRTVPSSVASYILEHELYRRVPV